MATAMATRPPTPRATGLRRRRRVVVMSATGRRRPVARPTPAAETAERRARLSAGRRDADRRGGDGAGRAGLSGGRDAVTDGQRRRRRRLGLGVGGRRREP